VLKSSVVYHTNLLEEHSQSPVVKDLAESGSFLLFGMAPERKRNDASEGHGEGSKAKKKVKKEASLDGDNNKVTSGKQFEVTIRKNSNLAEIAKTLREQGDSEDDSPTTIVLIQCEDGVVWPSRHSIQPAQIFSAIASIGSVTNLRFVNLGRGSRTLELEMLTELMFEMGNRLESVVFDGCELAVWEGWPACQGPMGMEEFEEAIQKMECCRQFDLINGFCIQYWGNPATGAFDTPVTMRLDSILNTIRKLPMLTKEASAKIKVTDEDAAVAEELNQDRAAADSQRDGFLRLPYYSKK